MHPLKGLKARDKTLVTELLRHLSCIREEQGFDSAYVFLYYTPEDTSPGCIHKAAWSSFPGNPNHPLENLFLGLGFYLKHQVQCGRPVAWCYLGHFEGEESDEYVQLEYCNAEGEQFSWILPLSAIRPEIDQSALRQFTMKKGRFSNLKQRFTEFPWN